MPDPYEELEQPATESFAQRVHLFDANAADVTVITADGRVIRSVVSQPLCDQAVPAEGVE